MKEEFSTANLAALHARIVYFVYCISDGSTPQISPSNRFRIPGHSPAAARFENKDLSQFFFHVGKSRFYSSAAFADWALVSSYRLLL